MNEKPSTVSVPMVVMVQADAQSGAVDPSSVQSAEFVTEKDWEDQLKPPKRPMSGYNVFFMEQRREIVGDAAIGPDGKPKPHHKVSFSDLAKHIASKWKRMDATDRQPYEEISAVDKSRYKREKNDWLLRQKLYQNLHQQPSKASPIKLTAPTRTTSAPSRPPTIVKNISAEDFAPVACAYPDYTSCWFAAAPSRDDVQERFFDNDKSDTDSDSPSSPSPIPQGPTIQDLASRLDDDCIELLLDVFS